MLRCRGVVPCRTGSLALNPMMLLALIVIAAPFAIWLILALLGAAMGQAGGVVSFLLYLVGAGILFAVGFFTARLLLDLSEQQRPSASRSLQRMRPAPHLGEAGACPPLTATTTAGAVRNTATTGAEPPLSRPRSRPEPSPGPHLDL